MGIVEAGCAASRDLTAATGQVSVQSSLVRDPGRPSVVGDVDNRLLESALEMCDLDIQAKKVMLLGHLLTALWTALDDPDARQSLAATCAVFETYVLIELTTDDGQAMGWDLDDLAERVDEDGLEAVIATMISG